MRFDVRDSRLEDRSRSRSARGSGSIGGCLERLGDGVGSGRSRFEGRSAGGSSTRVGRFVDLDSRRSFDRFDSHSVPRKHLSVHRSLDDLHFDILDPSILIRDDNFLQSTSESFRIASFARRIPSSADPSELSDVGCFDLALIDRFSFDQLRTLRDQSSSLFRSCSRGTTFLGRCGNLEIGGGASVLGRDDFSRFGSFDFDGLDISLRLHVGVALRDQSATVERLRREGLTSARFLRVSNHRFA